jgi:hypothetical protein
MNSNSVRRIEQPRLNWDTALYCTISMSGKTHYYTDDIRKSCCSFNNSSSSKGLADEANCLQSIL